MSDDNLIHPPAQGASTVPEAEAVAPAMQAPYPDDPYLAPFEAEEGGIDLRRYFLAVLRYKWLLVLALTLGGVGAYFVWTNVQVTYTAVGNLWIESGQTDGDGTAELRPIRAGGLLESNAWIELLRSFSVMEHVAREQGLFVTYPPEFAPAFESFSLAERFAPGAYDLHLDAAARGYFLVTPQGAFVEEGVIGEPIGTVVGFDWTPEPGAFPPQTTVSFTVVNPREAAQALSERLDASVDQDANFLALALQGTDPVEIASTLNAVMNRHVDLAAELKRSKLDETLIVLEDQLESMESELANAEEQLEEFRIATISLPTDQTLAIAPGLEVTRNPVFDAFFEDRLEVQEIARDRERLEEVLASFDTEGVRIETLEVIQAAASSSQLSALVTELLDARAELRVLRNRYEDDYGPIRELQSRIRTLEQEALPTTVRSIIDQLAVREAELQASIDVTAQELEQIPPRTIEEARLSRRVATFENLYNDLRGRVETARLAVASSIPDVRILDSAVVPQRPTEDPRLRFAAAILFGCLGAAVAGALLLDRVDAKFRYAADVSRDVGLDILGSVPRIETGRGRQGVLNAAQALEAFRELRIHVSFAFGAAGPITVTITSPSAGEGKSLIASNLAVAFAEVGRRTLLIDGDTRRGDVHRLLGVERSPGLVDYLKERSGEDIIQSTDHRNLDFIGSGSRGVSTPELLASPRMAYFMGAMKRAYDVIIVDSPPLASGGDPLILSSLTGNLALVIRTGTTEKGLTHAKLDQLSRLPLRVLGAILNDVSVSDAYHSYYTSYLPGYEPVPEEGDETTVGGQLLTVSVSQPPDQAS